MARITVDDCLKVIPNRFEMSLAATYRARQITNGAQAMIDSSRDKPTVIALREIAEGHITPEILTREDELDAEQELADVMDASELL